MEYTDEGDQELTVEQKLNIIQNLESRIGSDITDLRGAYEAVNEISRSRQYLHSSLNIVNNEVPTKLSTAIANGEENSVQVERLKTRSRRLKIRMQKFLNKTEPLRNELNARFAAICKYEGVLLYLKAFEKVDDLSAQLKQCTDDEQAVLLYSELKEMCSIHSKGHLACYVKENTHFWHNNLKDKFTKQYEDVLKLLKWPFTTAQEHSPPPKEVLTKFGTITRYLFQIEEPKETGVGAVSGDFSQDQDPCLPVRILLRPLKKRFLFHFTGPRQTARIDRPEWFLTQTLTWMKDHQAFLRQHVQAVADRLNMRRVKAEEEFNAGLISFAAERLHTVLGLYQTQNLKGDVMDVDAAFAHAVDETLGFHKELLQFTGKESHAVLSVLTKAETFVKWLAVEKKYALAKMDETLGSEQWMDVAWVGTIANAGVTSRVPRGADWLVALLKTIEDRYTMLPQPGHRLQFLELQLELIEEWRVRLTQLLSAAVRVLTEETFLTADSSPDPLTAVVNSAQHIRIVLVQWANKLHYLQLHYYRSQFQHFTQQQHRAEPAPAPAEPIADIADYSDEDPDEDHPAQDPAEDRVPEDACAEPGIDETMSLSEVEMRARNLALEEMSRKNSTVTAYGDPEENPMSLYRHAYVLPKGATHGEDAGVFGEASALLARLRDAGLAAFAEHMLLEFKAGLRPYKRQKWHAMTLVEEMALSVSAPLCRPLGGLCARLHAANAKLSPALCVSLRTHVAAEVDQYIFEEVVLQSWWSTGGTMQFTHDVKRNLVPAFTPPGKLSTSLSLLPKLLEACKLLNLDYSDARRLQRSISKDSGDDSIHFKTLRVLSPKDALKLLTQRTDLSSDSPPPSVMEMF